MLCACCGLERDESELTALQRDAHLKVCRGCIEWLTRQSGGIDVTPTLPVTEIAAATRFCEAAGFEVEVYDDHFAFVRLGEQSVFDLEHVDGLDPATNHAGCYVVTEEVDEWHARFTAAELDVTPIDDMPWGMHEFSLRDPSGNRIRIGRAT